MNVDATVATIVDSHIEAVDDGPPERWFQLKFTWQGKPFDLEVAESDRVYDLKAALLSLTNVPPERQKILGLVKGSLPPDQERLGNLNLAKVKKFTLIGQPEGQEVQDASQLEFLPDVLNDFDIDFFHDPAAAEAYRNDQRNIRKVKEMTRKLQINIINPLRAGKRLLVLDIDYTILDTKPLTSGALPPNECARPGLHEFLEAVYPHYDICFWSQTSWMWLEAKLVELGLLGDESRNYKIAFVLDKTCMFTVFSKRNGKEVSHQVKPLQIIWNHFPEFSAENTVHIDDLSRNFALNPGEGLKIHAFKDAHTTHAQGDRELSKLTRYLTFIATNPDFRTLDHSEWKHVVRRLPPS